MIAGHIVVFRDGKDDPEHDNATLIELTEWGDREIEVAASFGKQRVYLRFRHSDLVREIKEARDQRA